MYRCECCGGSVGPRKTRLLLIDRRPDGNVKAEYPVCASCKSEADQLGESFDAIASRKRPYRAPFGTGERKQPEIGGKSLLQRR